VSYTGSGFHQLRKRWKKYFFKLLIKFLEIYLTRQLLLFLC